MSANILEAIQGFATPAMIAAATSTLGLNDEQASTALGAAVTSILGGALQNTANAGVMTNIASLAGAITPDASMFSNIAGMLSGGVPTSPLQVLGNRFLGQIFGVRQAATIAALASATGISGKAASGLMTLAAPMALAAIRSKLGAAPTAASVANLLTADRGLIAQAMPASLRSVYGLVNAVPAAAAAVVAAAAPVAVAAPATKPSPVAHTSSGHASAPMAAAPAPPAPAPAPAPAPVAPAPAAKPAMAPAPAAVAPMAAAAKAAEPVAMAAPAAATGGGSIGTLIALMIPIALATAAIWYWAYGQQGVRPAAEATKTVAAPVAEKKAAAAPAPAPVAAPAPAKSTILAGVPTAAGLKYTLPGGATIDVLKDGVENKLIDFITGPSEVDKKTWFNFDRLSFETASTDLTASSKAQVEAIVAILKAYPAVKVKIGGYTDNQGDPQANMKLSDARAKRVADEISKLGIAADRVEAEGYGEQFPVGDNATPEGRAKNRRTALSVRAK